MAKKVQVRAGGSMEGLDNKEEKWINGYSSKQQILLVGEGDFSFALSLAKAFGSATNMIATSLDSHAELSRKYSEAIANVEELKKRGCAIIHEVDAHTMTKHPLLCVKQFDRIVFNFPHAGFSIGLGEGSRERIKAHQDVVSGFFVSAKWMVKGCYMGEIHVTHKTAHPFCLWEIETLAEQEGLSLLKEDPFCLSDYPGYTNKKGDSYWSDNSFPVGACSTFKFRKL